MEFKDNLILMWKENSESLHFRVFTKAPRKPVVVFSLNKDYAQSSKM